MHVGVFLNIISPRDFWCRLPHARGGVSLFSLATNKKDPSSPCTWGCFLYSLSLLASREVFPMHVGVFL